MYHSFLARRIVLASALLCLSTGMSALAQSSPHTEIAGRGRYDGLFVPRAARPATIVQGPTAGPYSPITAEERGWWWLNSTLGPKSIGAGIITSAWFTARNKPEEWHGTWEGFGKRLGSRQARVGISNTIEASLGAIWGEDPRYIRSEQKGFGRRAGHAFGSAFVAYRPSGRRMPAIARYLGIFASSFIANAWHPPSANNREDALERAGWAFGGRIVGNLFTEFWPEIRRKVFRK